MPFSHVIDHDRKTMRATATGTVRLADILLHLKDERHETALGYAEVIDARDITVDVSHADVTGIVDTLRTLAAEHRLGPTAIVVTSDHAYGMVHDTCAIRAFRDMDEAAAWLKATAEQDL
jgi:hypothetical protein